MKEKKVTLRVEKETIIREIGGEKMQTTTVRVLIGNGQTMRTVVMTPASFRRFQKEVAKVAL